MSLRGAWRKVAVALLLLMALASCVPYDTSLKPSSPIQSADCLSPVESSNSTPCTAGVESGVYEKLCKRGDVPVTVIIRDKSNISMADVNNNKSAFRQQIEAWKVLELQRILEPIREGKGLYIYHGDYYFAASINRTGLEILRSHCGIQSILCDICDLPTAGGPGGGC